MGKAGCKHTWCQLQSADIFQWSCNEHHCKNHQILWDLVFFPGHFGGVRIMLMCLLITCVVGDSAPPSWEDHPTAGSSSQHHRHCAGAWCALDPVSCVDTGATAHQQRHDLVQDSLGHGRGQSWRALSEHSPSGAGLLAGVSGAQVAQECSKPRLVGKWQRVW